MLGSTELHKIDWTQSIVDISMQARKDGWQKADILTLWRTHDLMAELFSGRYRGGGRPFVCHLAGTAALAMRHDNKVTTVLAAYAHAAYEQGEQGRLKKGASSQNRAELRSVLGSEVEEIVYRYRSSDWEALCSQAPAKNVSDVSEIERDVLYVQIVNELEDSSDADAHAPAWRTQCTARLEAAAKFAGQLGHPGLQADLNHQIEWISRLTNVDPDFLRPKRSKTIKNRAMRRKSILSKGRKWTRKLTKWLIGPSNPSKI